MAGFRFEALDAGGRRQRGVLEVDSARQARAVLRERGLWALEVDALVASSEPGSGIAGDRAERPAQGRVRRWRRGLTASQLSLIMRQFATLIAASLTLEQALNALIEQAESQGEREVLAGLRGEVLGGQSLGRAMEKYPRDFPEMYRTLIAAGERSGQLAAVMLRLADYAEQRQALRAKVGLVLVYPLIITAVALLVIVVLMTHVVPQVTGVFAHNNQTLPWLTRALIAASAFTQSFGIWFLAAIGVCSVALVRALRRPAIRMRFDALLLRLPVIGPVVRSTHAARFASTLAILVQSGVPLIAALRAANGVVGNRPMRRAVEEAERRVAEGATLSRSLARSALFPPMLVHLVSSGEATGELGVMLERAAASQTRDLEHRVGVLTSLFEPLLIVVMGGIVLLIVLATLMPIIELNQIVR